MPGMDPLSDDLLELIDLLKSKNVEFLIAGAHALAVYALPRQTQDLDIWIRRSPENAGRVRAALDDFGFAIGNEGERQLTLDQNMLQLGHPPNRVDILTFLDGCDFNVAWPRRQKATLQGREIDFVSLEDYIATKRTCGRAKDLDDLNRLREHLGSLPDE
jgi:predicted nucleotidyltransferase